MRTGPSQDTTRTGRLTLVVAPTYEWARIHAEQNGLGRNGDRATPPTWRYCPDAPSMAGHTDVDVEIVGHGHPPEVYEQAAIIALTDRRGATTR